MDTLQNFENGLDCSKMSPYVNFVVLEFVGTGFRSTIECSGIEMYIVGTYIGRYQENVQAMWVYTSADILKNR